MGCGKRDKSNHTFRRSISWSEQKDGVWRVGQVKSHSGETGVGVRRKMGCGEWDKSNHIQEKQELA